MKNHDRPTGTFWQNVAEADRRWPFDAVVGAILGALIGFLLFARGCI